MVYQSLMIFISGLILGILIGAFIIYYINRKVADTSKATEEDIIRRMKEQFADVTNIALEYSRKQLTSFTESTLKNERELSTIELGRIDNTIQRMQNIVRELEKDREMKFGELTNAIIGSNDRQKELSKLTHELHAVLYKQQARGQWGERMADDVLRMAGFVENINYRRQQTLESNRKRPDFTFLLPKGKTLNMDVKFPLDNYSRFINTDNNDEKARYLNSLLSDVKKQIKEIDNKEYRNTEAGTVDCALLFIPSDSIYSLIFEADSTVIDFAMERRIIPCSPITLFAVLAVIKQAVDNFTLEKSASEILTLMQLFYKEWDNYTQTFDQYVKKMDSASKELNELSTTRKKKVDSLVFKINNLEHQENDRIE